METIIEQLKKIEITQNTILNKITEIEKNISQESIQQNNQIDIKTPITLDVNIIKYYLEKCNIESDIKLLLKFYKKSFNIDNKKKISYFMDNKWENDEKKLFIELTKRLKIAYSSINISNNYKENINQIPINQLYIMNITNDKNMEQFVKTFKNILLSYKE